MERWFTPQERGVILFLVATLLLGIITYLYKSKTPYFAPELKILSNGNWAKVEEYESTDSLEQLIQQTESKLTQQTGSSGGAVSSSNLSRDISVAKININIATEAELITLPGIGPALAKRIIEYRERSGGFKILEDIIKVRGIGQKKFEALKDKITI